MSDTTLSDVAETWVTATRACSILGVQFRLLQKLVAQGRVAVRQVPGGRPRYLKSDILSLSDASVRRETAVAV